MAPLKYDTLFNVAIVVFARRRYSGCCKVMVKNRKFLFSLDG